MTQLERFSETLPQKPYCTDNYLNGITIRPKEQAIKKKFIQPNNPWNWNYLVFDVDRPEASLDWFDLGCPAPTIISQNPDNGHAHLFYGLETPVYTQDGARNKPLRYAGAVSVALSRKLEADPSYNGLLSKNPLNPHWITEIIDPALYTLKGLAGYLDLGELIDSRKHLPETALGRNCTLFDETRFWAYRQIRSPQSWLSEDFFIESVTEYAGGYNALNFAIKLPYSEIKAIGKSVGRWTYRNMSYQGFREWGNNRRIKSIRVRKAGSFEKAQMVKLYRETHPEASIRAIGRELGLPESTVRWLFSL
jgi:hypothetical protein